MARFVIADASPLIGLSIVGGLPWLKTLFEQVWLPEQIVNEILTGQHRRGEAEVQAALEDGWLKRWPEPLPGLPNIDLDDGESACIQLALTQSDPVLLIIDERAGRAVATEHGISIIGTAAIIGQAKQRGLIKSAKDVFETLHQSDFRISPQVIKTILKRVE